MPRRAVERPVRRKSRAELAPCGAGAFTMPALRAISIREEAGRGRPAIESEVFMLWRRLPGACAMSSLMSSLTSSRVPSPASSLSSWLALSAVAAALVVAVPAQAQQSSKPAPAKPAAKPAAPAAPAPSPAAPSAGNATPALLGQFGAWGAYTASPGGKKVCFALAKPETSTTNPPNRPRDPTYVFVSTRPAEKVRDEISVIIGYGFKPNSDATLTIGGTSYEMATRNDSAWLKNAADESKLVDQMRRGSDMAVKGTSGRGTTSTDTYSLKGLAQALDRVAQECR
jgi:hypothetical protein